MSLSQKKKVGAGIVSNLPGCNGYGYGYGYGDYGRTVTKENKEKKRVAFFLSWVGKKVTRSGMKTSQPVCGSLYLAVWLPGLAGWPVGWHGMALV